MTNTTFQGNNQFNPMNQMQNQNMQNNYGYQQIAQSMNRSFLPGRIVFSPDQITPQEIPSDGSPALFPLFDGSKIIIKSFNENGMFKEDVYVLQQPQEIQSQEAPVQNTFDQVISRIDSLEESINKALKDLTSSGKAEPKTQKKAVNGNEQ